MKADRRKNGDILWLAFQYAKQDRTTLIDAYGGDETQKAVREAKKDIAAFERMQMRLFGTTKSTLDKMIDKMVLVDLTDISNIRKIADGTWGE